MRPWVGKNLRGKFGGSSRDMLWSRVKERGGVDLVNAQFGADLPRGFQELGLGLDSV